jgi:hypothetical protein
MKTFLIVWAVAMVILIVEIMAWEYPWEFV